MTGRVSVLAASCKSAQGESWQPEAHHPEHGAVKVAIPTAQLPETAHGKCC